MNKNIVISVLAALVLIGSIWGSIANKKKILFEDQLAVKEQEFRLIQNQNDQVQEQVLAKTADLQKVLQDKERQVLEAREELIRIRKTNKRLEAKLSVRSAAIVSLTKEKKSLASKLAESSPKPEQQVASGDDKLSTCQARLEIAEKNNVKLKAWLETKKQRLDSLKKMAQNSESATQETSAAAVKLLKENLVASQLENKKITERLESIEAEKKRTQAKLRRELGSAQAQVIGMEKIIEEKNNSIEDTGQELDRLKINMDVLLTKIAEQQDSLQELQDETKELVKELVTKNEQLADLNEQLLQSPVN